MNFHKELEQRTASVENVIRGYLPKEEGYQKTVLEAMNYSLQAGGKRLRPMMMREVFRAYGGRDALVQPFMAAIEMIHTYSLVHDDLPEMDDDELRRGQPTTHIKYGQAMAVLAGDALLNYSVEILTKAIVEEADPAIQARMCHAMRTLYHKAGIYGMIGGQTKDVEAEKKGENVDLAQILFIDECKTAALIQAALMIGAILAGASAEDIASLEKAGYHLGVAFQIQDDILDVTGTDAQLGKPVGSDAKNKKATYVTAEGIERAQKQVKELSQKAVQSLAAFPGDSLFLQKLIISLIDRKS